MEGLLPTVDPSVIAGVWALVFALRGLIPAKWIDLDGKEIIWPLVILATVIVFVAQGRLDEVNRASEVAQILIDIAVSAGGSILADGAAKKSGLSDALRQAVTLGGTTNKP